MVRIPDMMRVPGQTFEGITADGKRVWAGGACRLMARQTVRPSLFSRGGAGPMVWWSTPAAYGRNFARARARATVQSVAS